MVHSQIMQQLIAAGVVPVIRTDTEEHAQVAVEALVEGGIAIAEITMTTPNAISVIEKICRRAGNHLIVGAGSVTETTACKRAIDAGCRFVVTPTVNLEIIEVCRINEICVLGGALTPTEILSVWRAGADAVKVFPAKVLGGPDYIRTIHEPLPGVPIVPTGGVCLENIAEYLLAGAIFVGSGGDLVNREALRAGKPALITERAKQYVAAIGRARAEAGQHPCIETRP